MNNNKNNNLNNNNVKKLGTNGQQKAYRSEEIFNIIGERLGKGDKFCCY